MTATAAATAAAAAAEEPNPTARPIIDLIDVHTRKNIQAVEMRWTMMVKDHSTGITYLAALPLKRPKFVVFELNKQFGLIGYPTIFHNDNGSEFTSVSP
jgi:hypothetical protein